MSPARAPPRRLLSFCRRAFAPARLRLRPARARARWRPPPPPRLHPFRLTYYLHQLRGSSEREAHWRPGGDHRLLGHARDDRVQGGRRLGCATAGVAQTRARARPARRHSRVFASTRSGPAQTQSRSPSGSRRKSWSTPTSALALAGGQDADRIGQHPLRGSLVAAGTRLSSTTRCACYPSTGR